MGGEEEGRVGGCRDTVGTRVVDFFSDIFPLFFYDHFDLHPDVILGLPRYQ